ncbi:putative tyrosine 3-monooxygenase [Gregarina niphandrodes]|uniref:Tyrosine 3-monooxygenase n=1 Tax=Gregarina niphandrodes TaxID=110365 RepID=A0A023B6Z6_GRENI|nr:putative tyrosine 3-monooxygenase [Gregarina niphandrodes]EZG66912.1 putative tyrosine 3-monooxygenase [Gregarina niphandrodes]|eukprot:XP_011130424.1 putative tyrosine 3-monooxygenase [Gregarina niphandrodes]
MLCQMHSWNRLLELGCSEFQQWNRQERALFSDAVRNVLGRLRTAYRLQRKVKVNKQKSRHEHKDIAVEVVEEFMEKTREDFLIAAERVLRCVDRADGTGSDRNEVACWVDKIRGDVYRYWAELDRSKASDCVEAYEAALDKSNEAPLGLRSSIYCNLGCFYAEVEKDKAKAQQLAHQALNNYPQIPREYDEPIAMAALNHNRTVWA